MSFSMTFVLSLWKVNISGNSAPFPSRYKISSYHQNKSLFFHFLNNSLLITQGWIIQLSFLQPSSSASSSETGEREQFYLGKLTWIFLPYFYCVLLYQKQEQRDIKEMSNFYSSEQHMLKRKKLTTQEKHYWCF